jgi:hypothetical protein
LILERRTRYADIPKGAAREHEKDAHGNVLADYTLWIFWPIADRRNRVWLPDARPKLC